MLNKYQSDYLRDLDAMAPDEKCYCGWFQLGECPHCPPGMTVADRIKVSCPECHNYPPALDPERPITHNIKCSRSAPGQGAIEK